GQRRDLPDLAGVRDLDHPAAELELVLDPDRAAHRLNTRLDLTPDVKHQASQTIPVRRDQPLALDSPTRVERAPSSAPIRPIDSDIVHAGSPLARTAVANRRSNQRGGGPFSARRSARRHAIPCKAALLKSFANKK